MFRLFRRIFGEGGSLVCMYEFDEEDLWILEMVWMLGVEVFRVFWESRVFSFLIGSFLVWISLVYLRSNEFKREFVWFIFWL